MGPSHMTIYYDDIEVGETMELGSVTLSEAELRSFAEQYDPQPFHIDEAAARERGYDGLIASGWQTIAVTNRIVVDEFLTNVVNLGGLGVSEIQWHAPVYAGDTLRVEIEAVNKRLSDSTGHGVVQRETRVATDTGQVLSYTTATLIARRDGPPPA